MAAMEGTPSRSSSRGVSEEASAIEAEVGPEIEAEVGVEPAATPVRRGRPRKVRRSGAVVEICEWEGCGERFGDGVQSLVEHLERDHIGAHKSTYSCEWAGCARKSLVQTSRFALISHCRSHTGEKPFVCSFTDCDKSFTRSDTLAKHRRQQHNLSATPATRGGGRKRKRSPTPPQPLLVPAPPPLPPPVPPSPPPPDHAPSHYNFSNRAYAQRDSGFNTFRVNPAPLVSREQDDSEEEDDTYNPEQAGGRSRAMVKYLIMKAKYRYVVDEQNLLNNELDSLKRAEKEEFKEKEASVDRVLRGLGPESEQLMHDGSITSPHAQAQNRHQISNSNSNGGPPNPNDSSQSIPHPNANPPLPSNANNPPSNLTPTHRPPISNSNSSSNGQSQSLDRDIPLNGTIPKRGRPPLEDKRRPRAGASSVASVGAGIQAAGVVEAQGQGHRADREARRSSRSEQCSSTHERHPPRDEVYSSRDGRHSPGDERRQPPPPLPQPGYERYSDSDDRTGRPSYMGDVRGSYASSPRDERRQYDERNRPYNSPLDERERGRQYDERRYDERRGAHPDDRERDRDAGRAVYGRAYDDRDLGYEERERRPHPDDQLPSPMYDDRNHRHPHAEDRAYEEHERRFSNLSEQERERMYSPRTPHHPQHHAHSQSQQPSPYDRDRPPHTLDERDRYPTHGPSDESDLRNRPPPPPPPPHAHPHEDLHPHTRGQLPHEDTRSRPPPQVLPGVDELRGYSDERGARHAHMDARRTPPHPNDGYTPRYRDKVEAGAREGMDVDRDDVAGGPGGAGNGVEEEK